MPIDPNRPDSRLHPAEYALAAAVALVPFAIYVATMYPGLAPIGDAAKFAFVGKILGTPHPPGYPLYVVVSHLFSYVPWGSLAHRMNGLSAVLGALTVAITYLVMRRMNVGRIAAASAALALGLGDCFWSRSLYAKGYTLNAALVAGGVLALLRWNRTRRTADLYWAAAIFALSTGNHLTVIALVPALVAFALLTEWRVALRPTTLIVLMVIGLLGFVQYGFIILRTLQKAPFLEAQATNLQELWRVMTARRFSHEIGAYSTEVLRSTRVPLIAGLIGKEFGPIGLPLLGIGLIVASLRQPRVALLLGLGAAGVAALTTNMGSNEDQGFLLPVFVLLWPLVGVGVDAAIGFLRRGRNVLAVTGTIVIALALPARQVVVNWSSNDHHAVVGDQAYFDALFAALPPDAAIVNDEYLLNMMVLYKAVEEGADLRRMSPLISFNRDMIASARKAGRAVFTFQSVHDQLADYGYRLVPFDFPTTGAAAVVAGHRRVYRLVGEPTCLEIGGRGWVDLAAPLQPQGWTNVRIDNYRRFDSSLIIYAASDHVLEPVLLGVGGVGPPTLTSETFRHDDARAQARLATVRAADGVPWSDAMRQAPVLTRVDVRVNDRGAYASFTIDIGGVATAAIGRAEVDLATNPKRAMVCSSQFSERDAWLADQPGLALTLDSNVFSTGWYPLERQPDRVPFRWTMERAELVIPIDRPRSATLTLRARSLGRPGRADSVVALAVNGHAFEPHPLPPGRTQLVWQIPAAFWRRGLNQVIFEIAGASRPVDLGLSQDPRVLGMAVFTIDLTASAATPLPAR